MWFNTLNKYKTKDDLEIIAEYRKNGNKDLIGILFDRYSHLVFGVCMKYLRDEDDSKDAVGNIFEKLIDDLKRFDIEIFPAWLHRVARNYCMMKLRVKKNVSFNDADIRMQPEIVEQHSAFSQNEDPVYLKIEAMAMALDCLSPEQRVCIEWFYLREKCYKEVSEITGYTMNEVKSHLQNGKRNLKIQMEKNESKLR